MLKSKKVKENHSGKLLSAPRMLSARPGHIRLRRALLQGDFRAILLRDGTDTLLRKVKLLLRERRLRLRPQAACPQGRLRLLQLL